MTRIGISGHQNIPSNALGLVVSGIREALVAHERPLIGYSSLAVGADQLFAREILAAGGELHAVIPAHGYERAFSSEGGHAYRNLRASATEVIDMGYPAPSEEAFEAAGRWIADHCDVLLAVWDGEIARGQGGTADIVAYARQLQREVQVIWPSGLSRD